ncbi:MAG: hypothetical protein CL819_08540 [Croceicoccus sp.]|nr:hypothetical protein [Croceicoccus sp.]
MRRKDGDGDAKAARITSVQLHDPRLLSEIAVETLGSVLSCFPLSSPSTLVSIRDEDGREVGILTDIKNLDAESQGVLQEELERSYFMPRITDIYAIEEDLNINTWKVETTRGPRVFQTRAERKSIRRMGGNYLVIRDVDGNRYEVRNWARLSPKARSYIESFI